MANKTGKKNDKDFPGYPHYPAKEDIMNQKENQRVDLDVENLSRSNKISSTGLPDKSVRIDDPITKKQALADNDADIIVPGTDADVTAEDLKILGEKDADFGRRDESSISDLDVPGSEDDDANEEIGEEDEENNYYSLGGDAHDNLEEGKE